jgi:hypothetical protein
MNTLRLVKQISRVLINQANLKAYPFINNPSYLMEYPVIRSMQTKLHFAFSTGTSETIQ